MYSEAYGVAVFGLSAYIVRVETDMGPGLPCFEMSGLLTSEVREAKERIRVAIKNSGFDVRPKRVVINFSPANIKKTGTGLDLSAALGVLSCFGYVDKNSLSKTCFLGELSLDGSLRPVSGALVSGIEALNKGFKRMFVPIENLAECRSLAGGLELVGAERLRDIVNYLAEYDGSHGGRAETCAGKGLTWIEDLTDETEKISEYKCDFDDIAGQAAAKKAAMIAAAGMHNLLLIGPPGSGKSMIAKRLPSIMPEMSEKERFELTRIYSIAGMIESGEGLLRERPFRSPGQGISQAAMLGGGIIPRPGEVSLASKGVLFLDELTQYKTDVIESLRQPLEDNKVMVSRMQYSLEFPADFMLVAAMNPCKCGYYPDRNRCFCSELDIERYIGKISKPVLDRFDMCVRTEELAFDEIMQVRKQSVHSAEQSSSAYMKERVVLAMNMQRRRFADEEYSYNSEIPAGDMEKYCGLGQEETDFAYKIFQEFSLTARGTHKLLKLSRTIADLDESDEIRIDHLATASIFKSL